MSEKIQKLRKERARTGNKSINITITDLDKRILDIIGSEYVQGLSDVPDSFPEEYNVSKNGKSFLFFYIILYMNVPCINIKQSNFFTLAECY